MSVRQLRVVVEAGSYGEAVRFYRDVLGLPEELALDSDGGARVTVLADGRATLELVSPAQRKMIDELEVGRQVSPRVRFAFEVQDAATTTRRLTGAGAIQVAPPTRTPWNSLNARLDAPAGLHITIFEDHGQAAAPAPADQAAAPGSSAPNTRDEQMGALQVTADRVEIEAIISCKPPTRDRSSSAAIAPPAGPMSASCCAFPTAGRS
jgi:predicted enzyme related to lactoylglutathione lyase